jgi:iron(II)-dependent oxidoreductase
VRALRAGARARRNSFARLGYARSASPCGGDTVAVVDLRELLADAGARVRELASDLSAEQLAVPYSPLVNPLLWELGHVAFFTDVFLRRALGARGCGVDLADELYDSFRVEHEARWRLPLPSRDDTFAYFDRTFGDAAARLPDAVDPSIEYLAQLVARHADMHGEAFLWMRQTLALPAPVLAAAAPSAAAGGGPLSGDAEVPGGVYDLGARPGSGFVFDNEKWAHPIEVAPFRIARAPVTNAEYVAFVDDGGYTDRALWDHDAWRWRVREDAEAPVYWRRDGGGWSQRRFDRWEPLAPHQPVVHVGWYEAEAYCRWAGRRLPTEAEWELAASTANKTTYPWGAGAPDATRANLDAIALGPVDVGERAVGDSAYGCRQMTGNVWEWTASAFYPYPGFVVDTPYREYSAPWFGYRKVLRGGAWATRARLAYNTYRNFFTPDRRDIFAGFRTCAV